MDLKQHQAKIEEISKGNYVQHSLLDNNGNKLISANPYNKPSKLPDIIRSLKGMPEGQYIIRCSKGKNSQFDYPINTATPGTNAPATNVSLSQAATDDLKTAERLGRLEAENAYLRQQLAEAGERIQALEAEALEEDWNDEADDILGDPAPSPKEQILEAIAPIIPALADKALALVDRFLNKPAAQPLSERAPAPAPVIDYERLAEMVSQKLMEAQEPEEIS
jgi:hypothetical protein